MRLQFCTWPEVERYLAVSRGVIVPLGSTEQHGPSGLIGTDALCAEAVAWRVGELYGVLIAPTVALGVAQFNLAFPGTLSLRASTLMAVIEDLSRSLLRHGFERIYFLNGHGGNIAPVKAALQDIYWPQSIAIAPDARPGRLRFRLRSWWEYPQTNALRRELYGDREGLHATPSEVAITQALYPDAVRSAEMPPAQPLAADFLRDRGGDAHPDAASHREEFPDGRVGSEPNLASADAGRRLLEYATEEAYRDYLALLTEA